MSIFPQQSTSQVRTILKLRRAKENKKKREHVSRRRHTLITMFMVKTIGTFMTQFERRCHALDTQMLQILFVEQGKMRVSLQAKTSQTMKQRLT